MRRKNIVFLLLIGGVFLSFLISEAHANIIIKVRALNPLENEEVAVIRYPLPEEITPDHIIAKNIIFSLPKEEDAEERKTTFNIEYVAEEGRYFIIDEIKMGPREVVTLETHVEDIWSIADGRFNSIRETVEGLIAQFPPAPPEAEENPDPVLAVTDETVIALQGEIFNQLDEIATRQAKSSVLLVGVERHMEAYYENMEALAQAEEDVSVLRNLLEPEEETGEEGAQDAEGGEPDEWADEVTILDEAAPFADPADPVIQENMVEPEIDLSE